MKPRWLFPLLIASAAAAVAFGLSRWTAASRVPPAGLAALQDASWLERNLNLSPAQAQDVRRLQEELRQRLTACDSGHCAARCRLGAALFRDDGTADSQAAVDDMCRMQAESEAATVEHIRKVYDLLTPEQRKRYEELVTTCVCATCSHSPTHEVEP